MLLAFSASVSYLKSDYLRSNFQVLSAIAFFKQADSAELNSFCTARQIDFLLLGKALSITYRTAVPIMFSAMLLLWQHVLSVPSLKKSLQKLCANPSVVELSFATSLL